MGLWDPRCSFSIQKFLVDTYYTISWRVLAQFLLYAQKPSPSLFCLSKGLDNNDNSFFVVRSCDFSPHGQNILRNLQYNSLSWHIAGNNPHLNCKPNSSFHWSLRSGLHDLFHFIQQPAWSTENSSSTLSGKCLHWFLYSPSLLEDICYFQTSLRISAAIAGIFFRCAYCHISFGHLLLLCLCFFFP